MKLFPLNRNSIALCLVTFVSIGFFIAGLCEVLDYFIMKVLLFTTYGALFVVSILYALKNDDEKNRPEDQLQDDSH